MKKLFTFLTLLIVSGMISPALAATYYNLYVGGVHVTSDNASNITGTGISGTVTYNNSTKTLTLTSATINYNDYHGIHNAGIDNLKIVASGYCKITSGYAGILCDATTTIKGSNFEATLVIQGGSDNCGIWARNCNYLNIDDIWLEASGGYGLYGSGDTDKPIPTLWPSRSNVFAKASKDGISCIQGFDGIITTGSMYSYSGYTYDTTKKQHVSSSGTITKSFYIRPRIAIGRYIWDMAQDATINSSTVGAGVTSGTFSYDKSTRTLTMNNVKMTAGWIPIRYYGPNGGGDLNIKVTGTNNEITMTDGASVDCIYAIGNSVNITGDKPSTSKLTVNNQKGDGIYLYSYSGTKKLNIKNVTLNVTSKTENAWSLYGGNTTDLTIDNSNVSAAYGIRSFNSCTLDGSYVSNGGEYSSSLKGFTSDGSTLYTGSITIYQGYDLFVGPKRVTKENADDILGDGNFAYQSSTNRLLIQSGTSYSTNVECIDNRIDDLTVWLYGDASLTSTTTNAIYSTKPLKITSQNFNTLTVKSTVSNGYCGIYMRGSASKLTIEDIWMDVEGYSALFSSDGSELWVDLSSVHAKTTSTNSCIRGFSKISTNGTVYDYDGAKYTSNKLVDSNGSSLTEWIVQPRLSLNKFIWNPRWDATMDNSRTGVTYGSLSYSNYTLTLNNVTINADTGLRYYGYDNKPLTIRVNGTNTIAVNSTGIYSNNHSINIVGDSKVSSKLNITNRRGVELEGTSSSTLSIEKVNLNVTADGWRGLSGSASTTLNIDNSEITVGYSIEGFGNCTMKGAAVAEPLDAYYSPSLRAFTLNGTNSYKDKMVIKDWSLGLKVAEKDLMASDAADILGDGTMSYKFTTKTLTLKNTNLTNTDGTGGTGIRNYSIDGLIINVLGLNNITTRMNAISAYMPFSITGTGTLNATSQGGGKGLTFFDDCTACTIDGPTVNFKANGNVAIEDYYNKCTLTIKGADTYVKLTPGSGGTAIAKLKDLKMSDGVDIVTPDGGYFSSTLQGITLDGSNLYTGEVEFLKVEKYGILVAETWVNSYNAADILSNGHVSYDPSTKTLTLDNANFINEGTNNGSGIYNRDVDGLKIEVVGDNFITTRDYTLGAQKPFSLIGSGSLTLNTKSGIGIYFANGCTDCTIDGPNITVNAAQTAIYDAANGTSLTLKNPSTRIVLNPGKGFITVSNLKAMQFFDDLRVIRPAGTFMSSALKGLTQDGTSLLKRKVTIASKDPADVNNDRIVDVADIATVISVMSGTDMTHAATADVNGDTTVDVADIAAVVTAMSEMSRQQKADMEE